MTVRLKLISGQMRQGGYTVPHIHKYTPKGRIHRLSSIDKPYIVEIPIKNKKTRPVTLYAANDFLEHTYFELLNIFNTCSNYFIQIIN